MNSTEQSSKEFIQTLLHEYAHAISFHLSSKGNVADYMARPSSTEEAFADIFSEMVLINWLENGYDLQEDIQFEDDYMPRKEWPTSESDYTPESEFVRTVLIAVKNTSSRDMEAALQYLIGSKTEFLELCAQDLGDEFLPIHEEFNKGKLTTTRPESLQKLYDLAKGSLLNDETLNDLKNKTNLLKYFYTEYVWYKRNSFFNEAASMQFYQKMLLENGIDIDHLDAEEISRLMQITQVEEARSWMADKYPYLADPFFTQLEEALFNNSGSIREYRENLEALSINPREDKDIIVEKLLAEGKRIKTADELEDFLKSADIFMWKKPNLAVQTLLDYANNEENAEEFQKFVRGQADMHLLFALFKRTDFGQLSKEEVGKLLQQMEQGVDVQKIDILMGLEYFKIKNDPAYTYQGILNVIEMIHAHPEVETSSDERAFYTESMMCSLIGKYIYTYESPQKKLDICERLLALIENDDPERKKGSVAYEFIRELKYKVPADKFHAIISSIHSNDLGAIETMVEVHNRQEIADHIKDHEYSAISYDVSRKSYCARAVDIESHYSSLGVKRPDVLRTIMQIMPGDLCPLVSDSSLSSNIELLASQDKDIRTTASANLVNLADAIDPEGKFSPYDVKSFVRIIQESREILPPEEMAGVQQALSSMVKVLSDRILDHEIAVDIRTLSSMASLDAQVLHEDTKSKVSDFLNLCSENLQYDNSVNTADIIGLLSSSSQYPELQAASLELFRSTLEDKPLTTTAFLRTISPCFPENKPDSAGTKETVIREYLSFVGKDNEEQFEMIMAYDNLIRYSCTNPRYTDIEGTKVIAATNSGDSSRSYFRADGEFLETDNTVKEFQNRQKQGVRGLLLSRQRRVPITESVLIHTSEQENLTTYLNRNEEGAYELVKISSAKGKPKVVDREQVVLEDIGANASLPAIHKKTMKDRLRERQSRSAVPRERTRQRKKEEPEEEKDWSIYM